jgi:hypothetical protein
MFSLITACCFVFCLFNFYVFFFFIYAQNETCRYLFVYLCKLVTNKHHIDDV